MNAYQRWASVVVAVLDAEQDLQTLVEWGRHVGMSAGTLRSRCAAAGQSAKASLDFARLLRLVARSQAAGDWDPAAELSSRDPRTVEALLRHGGLQGIPSGPTPSVTFFLDQQSRVPEGRALAALKQALAHRGVIGESPERRGRVDRAFAPPENDGAPDD